MAFIIIILHLTYMHDNKYNFFDDIMEGVEAEWIRCDLNKRKKNM